jgi:F-type H+-transporting ATPase subunit a
MGDLFSSFNPQTTVIFSFAGNWIACLSAVFIIPQGIWLIKGQLEKSFTLIIEALRIELKAVFGSLIVPGAILFFQSIFVFILTTNFLGLFPYVFTRSSHLRFTLRLSLPLWVGSVIYSAVIQFNSNIAHLVPVGTPGLLMPVIVLIERVRMVIRPGTLAVRLAANMVAGHLLLTLLGGQGPNLGGIGLVCLVVALVGLITLECGVACIQAYVFTILRSLYLAEHNRRRATAV